VQVIYSDEEKKFNMDIIVGLIRSDLLNLGEYNVHLAKLIDGGRNSKLKHSIFLLHVEFKDGNTTPCLISSCYG
jgi:hypothetical protein